MFISAPVHHCFPSHWGAVHEPALLAHFSLSCQPYTDAFSRNFSIGIYSLGSKSSSCASHTVVALLLCFSRSCICIFFSTTTECLAQTICLLLLHLTGKAWDKATHNLEVAVGKQTHLPVFTWPFILAFRNESCHWFK